MIKNILQIIAGVSFLVWANWFASSDLKPELIGMSIGIGTALLIQFLVFLYQKHEFLRIFLNCLVINRNKPLRLSMAYLFRIEAKGKYLLIKNSRFKTPTYQPVGGVYKYFHPEAKKDLHSFSIVTDNSIENDEKSENDLRIKMRKRSYIRKFINWFFSNVDREVDPWREFHEELVKPKIIPPNKFPFIFYDLIGQYFEPIHFDSYFKIDTLKYVDVFTPRFTNQKQKHELEKLLADESDDFIWATEEEIKNKISNGGKRIAPHTHKIFHIKKLK